MTKSDGGPAFARSAAWSPGYQPTVSSSQKGMTLRDFLAASVSFVEDDFPNTLFAEQLLGKTSPEDTAGRFEFWLDVEAKIRYMKADAMLKAREQC